MVFKEKIILWTILLLSTSCLSLPAYRKAKRDPEGRTIAVVNDAKMFKQPDPQTGEIVDKWFREMKNYTVTNGSDKALPMAMGSYFEGDIRFPPMGRNGQNVQSKLWKEKVIPYVIDERFNDGDRATFERAFDHYHRLTCIQFKPRENERDYLKITAGKTGCWSAVGRIGKGQELNLQPPVCTTITVVLHELMHAIGFFHEHTRPDRDEYLEIIYPNVHPAAIPHLQIHKNAQTTNFGVRYDYFSIMHYNAWSGSWNGLPTMIAKKEDGPHFWELGAGTALTESDILKISMLYKCSFDRRIRPTTKEVCTSKNDARQLKSKLDLLFYVMTCKYIISLCF